MHLCFSLFFNWFNIWSDKLFSKNKSNKNKKTDAFCILASRQNCCRLERQTLKGFSLKVHTHHRKTRHSLDLLKICSGHCSCSVFKIFWTSIMMTIWWQKHNTVRDALRMRWVFKNTAQNMHWQSFIICWHSTSLVTLYVIYGLAPHWDQRDFIHIHCPHGCVEKQNFGWDVLSCLNH